MTRTFLMTTIGLVCWISVSFGDAWIQTDWSGGGGQSSWSDTTMYDVGIHLNPWIDPGDLGLQADDSCWTRAGELPWVLSLLQTSDAAIYAGTCLPGEIFRSTDAGTTWVNTGDLPPEGDYVHSLVETSDGAIYAGICEYPEGAVFKSTDAGVNWVKTGDLAGTEYVYSLLQSSDGALYAGTGIDGDVFKSTDAGTTWANTGDLTAAAAVPSLLQASDGALYAGTRYNGDVFKSVDAGTTWVNTADVPGVGAAWSLLEAADGAIYAGMGSGVFKSTDAGATWSLSGNFAGEVISLLQTSSRAIYAGTDSDGRLYRTVDNGTTWARVAILGSYMIHALIEASDGVIYAGTVNPGVVFKTDYCSSGYVMSSVYNTESVSVGYGTMRWDDDLNGQTIVFRVRTDTLPDMSTAPEWVMCPVVVNGEDISNLSSVDDDEPYIQYRVELSTERTDVTPVLHEVSIEYEITGAEEDSATQMAPSRCDLSRNRPNPFSGSTVIFYSLPQASEVTLTVHDITGRLVETLVNETRQPGIHQVRWDRQDNPSGVYFYRLEAGEFVETRKMVLVD